MNDKETLELFDVKEICAQPVYIRSTTSMNKAEKFKILGHIWSEA
jgi:hypothetical protein